MFKVVFVSSIVAVAILLASTNSMRSVQTDFEAVAVTPVSAERPTSERSGNRVSAKALPYKKIIAISKQIDQLVEAKLKENSQKRNPEVDDATFLRRIYLDVVGRIPTLEETKKFLASRKPNKRALLIDELLDSYGYVSHQFNFWADLLRIKSNHRNIPLQPYIDFVKDSLESNKPYDQLVCELIDSGGPLMERDNGAVGYYLRDRQMPEDNMSNTIRVFLGTRLECAQCHDHPFDDWTQRQYFEMVAFTGGLQFKLNEFDSKYADDFKRIARNNKEMDYELRRAVRKIVEPMTYGVEGTGTGMTRLPEEYMGDDGEEYDIVKAKTMFEGKSLVNPEIPKPKRGKKPKKNRRNLVLGAKEIDSREAYAQWLTEPENPRFTKVMANRLWKQAMGMALIEPVDDMTKHTRASNVELMEYLTKTFEDLDYDMKQFLRAVYNSRTYQSRAMNEDVLEPEKFCFNGPVVRRMAAEQIWDSLLTLTISDVDQRLLLDYRPPRYQIGSDGGDIYEQYEKLRESKVSEIIATAERYLANQGKGKKRRMSMMEGGKKSGVQNVRDKVKKLDKEIAEARRAGKKEKMLSLMEKKNQFAQQLRRDPKLASRLNRASEIRSPANQGHFLREFGQSDRETIQNSVSAPAVTQALSLMNGVLDRVVNNPSTVLMKNVASADGAEEAVETVFLSMLNRKPTSGELAIWERDFKSKRNHIVLSDLIWTLANSNEFIFIK